MFTCPECEGLGKRRPRTFIERIFARAKLQCSGCNAVWYWRRVLVQKHTHCPDCGTPRLSKRSKYDRIDRKSKSVVRRFLGIFGAPIYHCTFCRLQFRDYHSLDPKRQSKVRASA
jgi:predicted RNA-binding Zn-ribbon protein involved in translation (DUF1610 family)